MEPYEVILYPLMGEKATLLREKENTLTFIVSKDASKKDVLEAAEKMLNIKIDKVRVMHTSDGRKKAHIKVNEKHRADEIASQMGVI